VVLLGLVSAAATAATATAGSNASASRSKASASKSATTGSKIAPAVLHHFCPPLLSERPELGTLSIIEHAVAVGVEFLHHSLPKRSTSPATKISATADLLAAAGSAGASVRANRLTTTRLIAQLSAALGQPFSESCLFSIAQLPIAILVELLDHDAEVAARLPTARTQLRRWIRRSG
jgi:hypothetical protein